MKSLLSVLALVIPVIILSSCSPEEEPSGGDVPVGKTFTVAVPGIEQSLANAIHVSENGQHIYVRINNSVSSGLFYSSDAGETFVEKNIFTSNYRIESVDNEGTVATSPKSIFLSNGTQISARPGYDFILGDHGKVFAYDQYLNLDYRDTGSGDFETIEIPAVEGGSQIFVKAPGKGIALIDTKGSPDVKVNLHLLDEQSLAWTSHTITINYTEINGCNNLNVFLRYHVQHNNMLIVKGCTGLAVCNLNTGSVEYVPYDNPDLAVYTDLRDNPVQSDEDGNLYMTYSNYGASQYQYLYQYNGSEWHPVDDYVSVSASGSIYQVNHNRVYYNSETISGTSIKGMTVWDIGTDTKTPLKLISETLTISEAVAIDKDAVLLIADNKLFKYNIGSGMLHRYEGMATITHVNVLPDGRWIAGSIDKLYLSSDNGNTWDVEEAIFSQVSGNTSMGVNETIIINGKLVAVGTFSYKYDNLSTGLYIDKYDNQVVELNGSTWSSLPYQFPNDYIIACISPQGTIYGSVQWINSFTQQYESKSYVVHPGMPAAETTESIPQLITDNGEHIVMRKTKDGIDYEIETRAGETGEWKATGTKFTPPVSYGNVRLALANGRLTLVFHSEVYVIQ